MANPRPYSAPLREAPSSWSTGEGVITATFLEYEDVLLRPELLAQGWASADQVSSVLDAPVAQSRLVQPIRASRRPTLPDPGDDLVLECAMEANAAAIITMNIRDFSGVTKNFGLNIMKPGELVAELRKEDP